MTPELHIIGIDPGGTTGWCRLTIPTKSIFGDEPSAIVEREYGEFTGDENLQVEAICDLARRVQSLAYRTGPALVPEHWDHDPSFRSTEEEPYAPLRINAKLGYARHLARLGDATVNEQSRVQAKSTATDERLQAWGLYTKGSPHIRDAHRHAITALRRAKTDPAWAAALWPYPAEYYR